MKTTHDNSDQ